MRGNDNRKEWEELIVLRFLTYLNKASNTNSTKNWFLLNGIEWGRNCVAMHKQHLWLPCQMTLGLYFRGTRYSSIPAMHHQLYYSTYRHFCTTWISNNVFTRVSLCVFIKCLCYSQIADFGMSRDLADETYYISSGGKIPVKWTAPEVWFIYSVGQFSPAHASMLIIGYTL